MSENKNIPDVIYILDKDLEYDLQINEVLNVEVSMNKMVDNDVAYILKSKYDESLKMIEELEKEWISVKDRLPDERFGTYLCCNMDAPEYNQCVFIADYFLEKEGIFKNQMKWNGYIMGNITHWKPLPKTPIKPTEIK